ncbi:MAG: ribosome maturation factor RimM [Clostridia bacterium]|nr:ribosome maturation factor RimM [Clostridia bacterium]
MQQFLQIGKIVNTHGIKGELKVIPLTDDPERFIKLKKVYIERNSVQEEAEIEGVKFFKSMVIIKLKGMDDMNAAETLKESYILVDRKNAVKLAEYSYFICDLIGCEVFDEKRGRLGILHNIIKTGSNDVYIVKGEENKEILIPALKTVVKEISVEDKKIMVCLPEGL